MSDYVNACVNVLKDKGYRVTSQRKTVLTCLATTEMPLSASEVYELVRDTASIDKVSVYRVLETLEELGLVHRVLPTGDYVACFHVGCDKMHHLLTRCSKCSSVAESHIPANLVSKLYAFVEQEYGFNPSVHPLRIEGRCANCS